MVLVDVEVILPLELFGRGCGHDSVHILAILPHEQAGRMQASRCVPRDDIAWPAGDRISTTYRSVGISFGDLRQMSAL